MRVTDVMTSPPLVVIVKKLLPFPSVNGSVNVPSVATTDTVDGPPVASGPPTLWIENIIRKGLPWHSKRHRTGYRGRRRNSLKERLSDTACH